MNWLKALCIAVGTYSILPVPRFEWDADNMRCAICFLPLVGVLCGSALFLWNLLCAALHLSVALFAAVATALPLIITGGIHMDGFMDTSDALASRQSRERKLEIMKDPHCGAFAVIRCAVYLLLSFGLYNAACGTNAIAVVCVGFVLSRALAVISALILPNARTGGMLAAFTASAARRAALIAMCGVSLICAGAMLLCAPVAGLCGILSGGAMLIWYRGMCLRQFGGAAGDTTGYFLQTCELAILLGSCIGGLLE